MRPHVERLEAVEADGLGPRTATMLLERVVQLSLAVIVWRGLLL